MDRLRRRFQAGRIALLILFPLQFLAAGYCGWRSTRIWAGIINENQRRIAEASRRMLKDWDKIGERLRWREIDGEEYAALMAQASNTGNAEIAQQNQRFMVQARLPEEWAKQAIWLALAGLLALLIDSAIAAAIAVKSRRLAAHLKSLGYDSIGLREAALVYASLGSRAFAIPHSSEILIIPGVGADAASLITFMRRRNSHLRVLRARPARIARLPEP